MRRPQDEPLRVTVLRRNDPDWLERYLQAMRAVLADEQPEEPEAAAEAAEQES